MPKDEPGAAPFPGDEINRLDSTFLLVYDELRQMAGHFFRSEPTTHTWQPTALINELYKRLATRKELTWNDRRHFVALARRMMRQLLLNHAEEKETQKRGGGWQRLPLAEAEHLWHEVINDFLHLHEALQTLAAGYPREAKVVKLRYFEELTTKEVAERLDVSVDTVKRDSRFARAFLKAKLSNGGRHLRLTDLTN